MSELSGMISSTVEKSILSVFGTMANLSGDPLLRTEDSSDIHVNGVGGFVQFAGPLSGVVYLLMSETLAHRVAASILGSDKVDANEVKDVIGELTNMVAGGLKNDLASTGFDSKLTIPTFIRSPDSRINVRNVTVATNNVVSLKGTGENVQVRVLARRMA